MDAGRFCLVLQAHLPFYGENDRPNDVGLDDEGKRWLYEAVAESHLPLLIKFNKLTEEKIDFSITISFSTILLDQLNHKKFKIGFTEYLNEQINRAKEDSENQENESEKRALAERHMKRYESILDYYNSINKDIISEIKRLIQKNPKILLGTSSLTHAFLPLYKMYDEKMVKFQIEASIKRFEKWFGFKPEFLWLPECGYYPDLELILKRNGIKYIILDPISILMSHKQPHNLCHFHNGIKVIGIDLNVQKKVWGDMNLSFGFSPMYRDYYAFDKKSKLKYWRVGNNLDRNNKEFYVAEDAKKQMNIDCNKLITILKEKFAQYKGYPETLDPDKPFSVVATDMEYFGHWWHEGPDWVEQFFKWTNTHGLQTATIKEVCDANKSYEINMVKPFSWDVSHEVWLGTKMGKYNDIVKELLYEITDVLKLDGDEETKNMIFREFLLVSNSDWAFEISNNRAKMYSDYRLAIHIQRIRYLINSIKKNKKINLTGIKDADWLFEDMSYKEYLEIE